MTATDLRTEFTKTQAKEHDTRLAEVTRGLGASMDRVEGAIHDIHRSAGDCTGYTGGRRYATWGMSLEDAIAAANRVAAGNLESLGARAGWNLRNAPQRAQAALTALENAQRDVAAAEVVVAKLEEVWRTRGRWARFFLVPNGHIHASTACRSLHPTTRIFWLPELSGESEADAVAAHGPTLCTHCFPLAPVEWTTKAPVAPPPDQCPASGRYVPGAQLRLSSPRGHCPDCGQTVSVTSRGNARKHKRA